MPFDYLRLYEQISAFPVIDTHEHQICTESAWGADGRDVLSEYLTQYLSSDIISAGMPRADFERAVTVGGGIRERWALLEPYWDACRHTGYARALDISASAIYGIDGGISAGTVEALNAAFQAAKKSGGHFERVFRQLCNIETALLDDWEFEHDGPSEYFKYIWQPVGYITPDGGPEPLERAARLYNIDVKSVDDWTAALEADLDHILKFNGVNIVKVPMAYWRSLRFERVARDIAGPLFNRALARWRAGEKCGLPVQAQDYMMHQLMRLLDARGAAVQFHTGLLEGNGNTLANSNPELLNNLFLEYPNVRFDLFHIGYPYYGSASALCKMFPNVTLDMCWAHIISPAASMAALDDFLDAVPYTKISAFGGDYVFPDAVYGHLQLARENVSRVLAKKIDLGVFGEAEALRVAHAMFYDNPRRIFQL